MNINFDLSYIDEPNKKPLNYKRILWLGVRNAKPHFNNNLHQNSEINLQQEISSVGTSPCLLVWETQAGEKKYAEVRKINAREA